MNYRSVTWAMIAVLTSGATPTLGNALANRDNEFWNSESQEQAEKNRNID